MTLMEKSKPVTQFGKNCPNFYRPSVGFSSTADPAGLVQRSSGPYLWFCWLIGIRPVIQLPS